jgi:hypothetical protein
MNESDAPKTIDAEMLVDALCGLATPDETERVKSSLVAEQNRLDNLKTPPVEKRSLNPDSGDIKGSRTDKPR